ncbi:uncharacterized protein LOC104905674 [Beta vulgaris subsp. vulgaris]|uniref:uncharacterized protein LOC104905674 n=1 Tax=Beta vulgaris subsp. vulgaris TaxID=3555 RepID=UPI0005402FA8|nr:uncharacterized protein LOC104905674 [Beta vulgaris subsp. vulgaris]
MAISTTDSVENVNSKNSEVGGNIDPLFISNSDNPTSALVAAPVCGVNFMRWSKNVRRALIAKNKEGFINGGLVMPGENENNYQQWKRANYMVMSWILSSMTADVADDFGFIETSAELWNELHERFGQSNGPLIFQLKKEIDSLKQENMTIIAYYGKIKRLWDELQSLKMLPVCTCGAVNKCSCSFLKRLNDLEAEDKLIQFLLGLNSGFETTISNILSMDPMPSLNKAFSIVQQIEKQKEITGVSEHLAESSAMAAQRMFRGVQQCNFQKYTGTGRKDWKKEKIAANVHTTNTGRGDSPLDDNEVAVNSLNSYMLSAICQEVLKSMKEKHPTEKSGAYASFSGKTPTILSCSVFKKNDKHSWIIDSGACDHMVYDESLLFNKTRLLRPIKVGLPDETHRMVELVGNVMLNDKITLTGVLLVKGFEHNFLSIGKIIEQTSVRVFFTKDTCYFQDHSSSGVIGIGYKQHGLYYFDVEGLADIQKLGKNNDAVSTICNALDDF